MDSKDVSKETEFQKAYQELIEAIHSTACADPDTEKETKTTLIEMINEALHMPS